MTLDTLYVLILRFVHIVAGMFWAGSSIFLAWFLGPAARKAGPQAAGPVMGNLVKGTRWMPAIISASSLTVAAGLLLYLRNNVSTGWAYLTSGTGITITLGALCGIAALIIGLSVSGPTANRTVELGAKMAGSDGPPAPEDLAEMAALQERGRKAGEALAGLLLLGVTLMALARYMTFF